MNRLYDDNLYRFDTPQSSYWEATAADTHVEAAPLEGDEFCDVAIIGGGYTGLSAALHLARDHDVDVRVLEAGHFGWGASGRNGGFCCMGSTPMSPSQVIKAHGLDEAIKYYQTQADAVELVREIGSAEDIDFWGHGDSEYLVAHTPKAYEALARDCEFRKDKFGVDAEMIGAGEFRERFYDSTEQFGAMRESPTFGLHPLRYTRGLASAAARNGAVLHDRSEVIEWSKDGDGIHRLGTRSGTLRARRVIFATNGFIQEGLRKEFYARTLPIISAIIVTRPLTDDQRAAHGWHPGLLAANTRRVLNYFRMLPDGRFLFGGRALGKGNTATEKETYARLRQTLVRLWPGWSDVEVEYAWHGLICFTGSLRPAIGQLEDDASVLFGHGYHGNGVAMGTWTGKKLAEWVGTGSQPDLPVIFQGLGKKFPLPKLRLRYLQLGIAASIWLDNRG